jgi:S-DNA-T family DNA segregation ATPase FtsK/SpoIIIE
MSNLFHRVLVYTASILHPYTIGRTMLAVARGVGRVVSGVQNWVSADDRAPLRDANAVRHDRITRGRAWGVGIAAGADVAVLLAGWFYLGLTRALAVWVLTHLMVLFAIGRTEPVMHNVITPWSVQESLITRMVNSITQTAESRKREEYPRIVSPVARLANGKGWECLVRPSENSKPELLLGGTAKFEHRMRKAKSTVFVYQQRADQSVYRLVGLDSDPWDGPPSTNPLVARPRPVNLWRDNVDFGMFPDGSSWLLRMAVEGDGGGSIVGARPRGGKTNLFRQYIAPIALHTGSRLHLVDLKGIDFKVVEPVCATYIADPKIGDRESLALVMALLAKLRKEVNRRRVMLLVAGQEHLTEALCRELHLTLEWCLMDELAVITEDLWVKHRKAVEEFQAELMWLVRMGPALGVFFILASQRPTAISMPPPLRGMITNRIALAVADVSASQVILGKAGKANRADQLDPEQKGVAIIANVGQVRFHKVTMADLSDVIQYAVALRSGVPDDEHDVGIRPEPVQSILDVFSEEKNPSSLPTWAILKGLMERDIDHSSRSLAEALRPFGITPQNVGPHGQQSKGYLLRAFSDVPSLTSVDLPSTAVPSTDVNGRSTDGVNGRGDDDGESPAQAAALRPE